MRYQVPQFVTIEDKIIGPFTLKQFLIYIFAFMLLVPIFISTSIPVFITIAVPILGISAAFAHFKLHGRSLFVVALSAVSFLGRGQHFIWKREDGAKLLPVFGEEYEQYHSSEVQTLSDRARSLEAVGNVVNEDVIDEIDPDAEPTAVTAGGGPASLAAMQEDDEQPPTGHVPTPKKAV